MNSDQGFSSPVPDRRDIYLLIAAIHLAKRICLFCCQICFQNYCLASLALNLYFPLALFKASLRCTICAWTRRVLIPACRWRACCWSRGRIPTPRTGLGKLRWPTVSFRRMWPLLNFSWNSRFVVNFSPSFEEKNLELACAGGAGFRRRSCPKSVYLATVGALTLVRLQLKF